MGDLLVGYFHQFRVIFLQCLKEVKHVKVILKEFFMHQQSRFKVDIYIK